MGGRADSVELRNRVLGAGILPKATAPNIGHCYAGLLPDIFRKGSTRKWLKTLVPSGSERQTFTVVSDTRARISSCARIAEVYRHYRRRASHRQEGLVS